MTAPPGGPSGQDPHGQDSHGQGPYGQDPSGTNPYEQHPYWGGQPHGGQPQYGQPPGAPYQHPQGGQPQYGQPQYGQPPGAPYQHPQGGPYQYPQGGPYAAGPYPPQQYPQPGQQYAPGWPGGPYPPGPPPRRPRSKRPWLIGVGIALLAIIGLVVALVVVLGHHRRSSEAAPSATTSAPTSPQPNSSQQNATDCTPNVSGGEAPSGDTLSAGPLSFPANAAPGWTPISDNSTPNAIGAVGLAQEVPGANQWMMQVEIATSNFVPSMDIATQASKLMTCMANGPGYSNSSPTLGPIKTSSMTVDGTEAARADADITIADPARNVKGDSVTIITVKTKPVTFFFGTSPIDDAASRATIDAVIAALKVTKS
ncbi:MAG: hypothetical protein JO106_03895 [Mycobacterium sp.]|nr:hypothetical protein [Mycobacterium sp.]